MRPAPYRRLNPAIAGRWVLLAAWAALVLGLTLAPQELGEHPLDAAKGPWGARGVADALVNVLLFIPLGGLLPMRMGVAAAVLIGAATSSAIELAQTAIPGRFPSLWDVAYNATGAAVGVVLARIAPALLAPPPRLKPVLVGGSLLAALALLIGGGALLVPGYVSPPLVAEWTPSTPLGNAYSGTVIDASIGQTSLPPLAGLRDSPMHQILAGDTLYVTFTRGTTPAAAVPVFRVSSARNEAAITLSVSHDDVVFSYRARAATLHLDQPYMRIPGALATLPPGAAVKVQAWARPPALCLRVQSSVPRCAAPSIGDTWALLLYPVPQPLAAILPHLWIGLLLLPAGFWVARTRDAAALAALPAACLLLTPALGLALPTPPLLAAAPAGLLLGHLLGSRVFIRRR